MITWNDLKDYTWRQLEDENTEIIWGELEIITSNDFKRRIDKLIQNNTKLDIYQQKNNTGCGQRKKEKSMENVLGKKGKDKITGFEGIITGHAKHLYGCDTYWLTPPIDKDGKMPDGSWFDDGRIEIIDDGVKPEEVHSAKNGADNLAAPNIRA